jgi:branched-chain amino acid transport system permease protein
MDDMGVSESYARGRELFTSNPTGFALRAGLILGLVFLAVDLIRQVATGTLDAARLGIVLKSGILRGLVIGLAGIGLSMTYSILNFANFSHGDYITWGAFSGWAVAYLIGGGFGTEADIGSLLLVGANGSVFGGTLGLGVWTTPLAMLAGLLVAGGSTIALALVVDKYVYKPIRDRSGITLLITSIGVAFALRYLMLFVFGGSKRGVTTSQPDWALTLSDGTVNFGVHDAALAGVSVLLMVGVHLLLQRTKLGKAMRAMADNQDLARVTGIPTEQVVRYTWIIGGGLTGVAGFMFVLWKGTLGYFDGWLLLLLIFAAVILGGIGSIYGAIVGGLIIGLTADLAVIWIPSAFGRAAAFAVMIVFLLVRPQGIFGGIETA